MGRLLEVKNLTISFKKDGQRVEAVSKVDFSMNKGEIIGLVGESGSGKSVTALSILGLLNGKKNVELGGEILLNGENILTKNNKELRQFRSQKMAMVFQDPMNSLNPIFTVGHQIAEVFMIHKKMGKKRAWAESISMLKKVGIFPADSAVKQYPHQFSGGMCQRVMIAMALSGSPELLIADEPTTALDVTVQAQILRLLHEFHQKTNTSILFITHDLGIVAQFAHSVAVMLDGEIVEKGDVKSIFMNPLHPYTQGLINSIPVMGKKGRLDPIRQRIDVDADFTGCKFYSRCVHRLSCCKTGNPDFMEPTPNHFVRCFKKRSR